MPQSPRRSAQILETGAVLFPFWRNRPKTSLKINFEVVRKLPRIGRILREIEPSTTQPPPLLGATQMTNLLSRMKPVRWGLQKDEIVQDRFDDIAEERMRPISRPSPRRH